MIGTWCYILLFELMEWSSTHTHPPCMGHSVWPSSRDLLHHLFPTCSVLDRLDCLLCCWVPVSTLVSHSLFPLASDPSSIHFSNQQTLPQAISPCNMSKRFGLLVNILLVNLSYANVSVKRCLNFVIIQFVKTKFPNPTHQDTSCFPVSELHP